MVSFFSLFLRVAAKKMAAARGGFFKGWPESH
jgi:hypothetical protein